MKAFSAIKRRELLLENAHEFLHILSRAPRRQFITSVRTNISVPSAASRGFTAGKSAKSSLNSRLAPFRRAPRQQQTRPNSTKQNPQHESSQSSKPSPNPTPNLNSPEQSLSLSQRLRKLSREYGWSALGVYLALSALDFPFCFAAVRMLGVERIGHWEHVIVNGAKELITYPFPEGTFGSFGPSKGPEESEARVVPAVAVVGQEVAQPGQGSQEWSWGVEAAQEANSQGATIWTQLALAYAIHKSFIFLRVPLTAAVTPKVVKTLRGWGWNIGKRKPKPQS